MGDGHSLWNTTGYTVNNPNAWPSPIPPTPLGVAPSRFELRAPKRPLSESDDCEDAFSEESSKDRCSSPNDDCQMGFSRKKRRGIIEKRRRDRINTSLSELRRLVPSAFEKQGSAKLEKAEILQLTVDHLKSMHSKGLDSFSYDPHKFAMDYHSIGFRECAAEVARYLVTVEGMDIQDPLRLRLMSHLQCFAAQRELASKQPSTPWNYNSYSGIHEYPTNSYDASTTHQHQPSVSHHGPHAPHVPPSSTQLSQPPPNRGAHAPLQPDNRLTSGSAEHHQGASLSPSRHLESPRSIQSVYPSHHPYPSGFPQQGGYNTSGQVKPYRPWGAEVAY